MEGLLASAIISANNNNDLVYFIHSISPSDVRAYGESAAKNCQKHVLLVSVVLRRLLTVFLAEEKRRFVPTLAAYQLTASPYAPEEFKIEILGARY